MAIEWSQEEGSVVPEATYLLAKQGDSIGFYAKVHVSVTVGPAGPPPIIEVTEGALPYDLDDSEDWPDGRALRVGVVKGVEYALANLDNEPTLDAASFRVIASVADFHVVDTTPDTVVYAACHATWKALGVTPHREPQIMGSTIVFPRRGE